MPDKIFALEGNGSRPSHFGDGYAETEISYTLNHVEQHGVCYGADIRNGTLNAEMNGTLQAKANGGWNANSNQVICYGIDQQGGKGGANYTEDVAPTMASDSHGTPHAICYGIGGYDSNSWKSSNPHSGVYIAETSRTLDAIQCGNPACNQGGTAIVEYRNNESI